MIRARLPFRYVTLVRRGLGFSRASSLLVWFYGTTLHGHHCCSHARRTGLLHEDVVYTVWQVVSACRRISEHFTYFPCKYVKSHFSGRVNDLSRAHYFFTEVERVTKHIVTREIRDNKIRELARVYLSRAVTTRWMSGALAPTRSSCRRCSSNLTFAITNLLITDVCTAGRDPALFLKYSKNNYLIICIIPWLKYLVLR